ncbi:MAG: hypothetical protein ACP5N1_02845 [Candidatus Woesearchaeota archaeon]
MFKDLSKDKIYSNLELDSIDKKIDFYWGKITNFDYSKPLEPQQEQLMKLMRVKYGADVIDKFEDLSKGFNNGYGRKEFIDFVYSKKLYYDIAPFYSEGGKEILKLLVRYLYNSSYCSFLDAGCGDLKIGLGLAEYLPRKINLIGIDDSEPAINIAKDNIKSHSTNIKERVIAETFDYTSCGATKNLLKRYPNIDAVILSRPDMLITAQDFISDIYAEGKSIIGCFSEFIGVDANPEDNIFGVLDYINYDMYDKIFEPVLIRHVNHKLVMVGEFR